MGIYLLTRALEPKKLELLGTLVERTWLTSAAVHRAGAAGRLRARPPAAVTDANGHKPCYHASVSPCGREPAVRVLA
jgi:hypothetical protein